MEFRILGPLAVLEEGRELPLGRAKQRLLLAVMLVRANELVSTDRLIEALWGDEPPETARTALHGHVSRLRKLLGDGRLLTRGAGYALEVQPGEVDLEQFERLVAEAREAREPAERERILRSALGLWRGDPPAELRSTPLAQAELTRLEELRIAVLEERVDAGLELGRDAELVPELERLVGRHPLR